MKYAVEQINNCSSLLPGVHLDFLFNDTKVESTTFHTLCTKPSSKSEHSTFSSRSEAFPQGDVRRSNAILIDHICNDIAAFVGPEGPNCNVEAMVAASKNRAMMSKSLS